MSVPGRRFAQGAEATPHGVSFRIYAPEHSRVDLMLVSRNQILPMQSEGDGFWSLLAPDVKDRETYFYRLDGEPNNLPDPCARYLPEGPHGPAEVVDPSTFGWSDNDWQGIPVADQVIYELHVGTFSPEGNWAGLEAKLPWLAELGVTTLELMPVAEFDGTFGWGYDGVAWFAPSHLYGTADGFRRVVDRAHQLQLAVILDVVYNHFGVSGDYTSKYSRHYAGSRKTEWGTGLNFDGPQAQAMRSLVIDNARYWIDEFHLDGLRLDATQAISDSSPDHIVSALSRAARAAAKGRQIFIVGENERQDTRFLRPHGESGKDLDALWNDDFHHSSRVALTGRRQAYLSDYLGHASEWIAAAKTGFLYQGQWSRWQEMPRGHATQGLPPTSFACFLENHDQVANSLTSKRLWQQSSPAQHRAMTALLLLGPWLPLLFQGQEWNSTAPFCFFAKHNEQLAPLVRDGRAEFLSQFPGCAAHPELLRDPASDATFEISRLRWAEVEQVEHTVALQMHRDLLRLRRMDPTLAGFRHQGGRLDVTTLSPGCGLIRYFTDGLQGPEAGDRILLVNLGASIELDRIPEPLLAPPAPHDHWVMVWNSEEPGYGGHGCDKPNTPAGRWTIPGCAAALLAPMTSVASEQAKAGEG